MKDKFHDGQILRISDLSVEAKVSDHGSGRNADNDGDCLRITEIRDDHRPSSYSYHRKDGEGWTDCTGEPVTIELVKDAPKPYRVGYESFFDEMLVAICEGAGYVNPRMVKTFAEMVRNHVATEHCSDQWRKLALATLRGCRGELESTTRFIEQIDALNQACFDVFKRRQEFYEERRSA